MCKKLFYLISFVLVLGLFTPVASAFDYFWFEAEDADTITGTTFQIFTTNNSNGVSADLASGKSYIGTINDSGNSNSDPPAADDGRATYNFNAEGGDYVVIARVWKAGSNSFWVTIDGAAVAYPGVRLTNPGWARWDGINGDSGKWIWEDVHSKDPDIWDNDEIRSVWTVSSGPQTLIVARREDGVCMDAILVTNDLSTINDQSIRSERMIDAFPKHTAWGPVPFNGQAVDPTEFTQLTWMPGYDANTHEVYFGTESPPPGPVDTKALGEPNYAPPSALKL